MIFIETSVFTSQIKSLLDDESYREFQNALLLNPESGDLIKGGGGIRKIRWKRENIGKRGGIRVIYYYFVSKEQIVFLYAYPKSVADDLTSEQLKILSKIVENWK